MSAETAAPRSGTLSALRRRDRLVLPVMLCAAAALAWLGRFVNDDAFISFRYARNLAEGHGLVFNIGERVEGYTNFLWTALLALPQLAGIDPVAFCYAAGPALAAATVYLTYRAALAAMQSRAAALLTGALLALNPSFIAWATGGLETGLLACLVAAIAWLMLDAAAAGGALRRNAVASVIGAAAVMTRLDASVVVGIAFAAIAWQDWTSGPARGRAARLAALAAPAALLVGAWLCWKYSYYGALLPNTYYAKVAAGAWPRGFAYLFIFFNSYLLWPFVLLVAFSAQRLIERAPRHSVPLLLMLAAHFAYVVKVGGDFMEFRLLVPVLPLLYLLVVWSLLERFSGFAVRAAAVTLLAAGALHHLEYFEFRRGIEPVSRMAGHLRDPASDWIGVGRALGRDLGGSNALIAVTPAGAIPYYSGLPTLDMFGLTDSWVARHGMPVQSQPGHRRLAPYSHLLERGVNLVVAHPWLALRSGSGRLAYSADELKGFSYLADPGTMVFPRNARIVEVPLDGERVLVALYLSAHPAIDARIAAGRWRAYPLVAAAAAS